jgi:hypothetical protein
MIQSGAASTSYAGHHPTYIISFHFNWHYLAVLVGRYWGLHPQAPAFFVQLGASLELNTLCM